MTYLTHTTRHDTMAESADEIIDSHAEQLQAKGFDLSRNIAVEANAGTLIFRQFEGSEK